MSTQRAISPRTDHRNKVEPIGLFHAALRQHRCEEIGIIILWRFTRVEIGHIRIGSDGNERMRSRGSGSIPSQQS